MYEFLEHTSDVRVRVSGATLEELFADAVRALFAALEAVGASDAQPVTWRVSVDSVDRTALLVDFLSDVLVQAHVRRVVFRDVRFVRLTETELEAELQGVAAAEFGEDVKAVTYHEADVRMENGRWQTMLVFDL